MSTAPIEDVIGRILTDQPMEGDNELLELWMSESETNRKSFLIMKETWDKTHIVIQHPRAEKIYQKLQHRLSHKSSTDHTRKWFLGIAASISLLLLSMFFVIGFDRIEFAAERPSIETIRKINQDGQKSQIHLPDGSIVFLNAGSSIEYTTEFNNQERVVHLTGEGFFEVKKNKKKPFKVISNGVVTTALGTSFDVRAFPESENIYVSLLSGKVRVEEFDAATMKIGWESFLIPGEQLVYHINKQETSKGDFDPREMVDWKDGVLYFKNTDLHQVVTKLERWFGVSINLKNIPSEVPEFSGEFKNESLENILQAMSYSDKIKYTIENKNILIECINP